MMENTREVMHKHNRATTWLILVVLPLFVFYQEYSPLSRAETLFHPVMTDGRFVEVVQEAPNGVIVSGEAWKSRACVWDRTEFFLGERGSIASRLGLARHLSAPSVRDTGFHEWTEIFLPIPREVFETGSFYADAIHTCDGREVRSSLFTRIDGEDQ